MRTVTQKYLRGLERDKLATNINSYTDEQLAALRKKGCTHIAVSVGVCGLNGAELVDDNGGRYVIVGRNTTLAKMV